MTFDELEASLRDLLRRLEETHGRVPPETILLLTRDNFETLKRGYARRTAEQFERMGQPAVSIDMTHVSLMHFLGIPVRVDDSVLVRPGLALTGDLAREYRR